MITLDLKTETPIQKSHNWLEVDNNGVLRFIRDFSYLPAGVVRYLTNYPVWAIFTGEKMITYDKDLAKLVVFDANGYITQSVAYGTTLERLSNGDIILQTDNGLYCFDQDLNQKWYIDRDGRAYGWYDRLNNVYYSPQASSLDVIDPATGNILNSASLPYNDFYIIRVGNYIIAHRRTTNKVYDLDLNLLHDNLYVGDYSNLASLPKFAGDGYWIGSKPLMYYTDALLVYYQVNDDGTFQYEYTMPMNRSLGRKINTPYDIHDWEFVGTRNNDYFTYIKQHGLGYAHHLYGYIPRTDMWIEYKVNTSEKIIAVLADGRFYKTGDVTFKAFDILISGDSNNWELVPDDGILKNQYTGTVYFRIQYNPEMFITPILGNVYFITQVSKANVHNVKVFVKKYRRVLI